MYIAPLIFGLAPVLNTVISLIWHPEKGQPFNFGAPAALPGWKLFVGIIFVAVGAALVLYSKAEDEQGGSAKPHAAVPTAKTPSS